MTHSFSTSNQFDRLFTPPSHRSPEEDDFNTVAGQFTDSANRAVTANIVISILALVVIVVLVLAIINCLTKILSPLTHHYFANKATSTYASIPNSDIEMGTMERFFDNIAREQPIRFSAQQLVEFTKNYSMKLGSGGFGDVYKGELPDTTPAAVKVLKTQILDKRAEEQFMSEVATISRTHHINLVRLYGFCFDESTKALVFEFMENGSLDKFLYDKNNSLEWGKLHEIAIGTAKGITYLHEECREKIVHYDIKPGNILLDGGFKPKVADFGLAKLMSRAETNVTLSRFRGTPGYAAPELWLPFPVTDKCDVYSFGILLFEILGRRRSLDFGVPESQEWFPRWVWEKYEKGEVRDVVDTCGIGEAERENAGRAAMIALWCAQKEPDARPEMREVVKMLEGGMEIAAPANPFKHAGSGLADGSSKSNDEGSFSGTETIYSTESKPTIPKDQQNPFKHAGSGLADGSSKSNDEGSFSGTETIYSTKSKPIMQKNQQNPFKLAGSGLADGSSKSNNDGSFSGTETIYSTESKPTMQKDLDINV